MIQKLKSLFFVKIYQKYEKLLIANSTFSWWAAFLGNSKTVYVPNDFGSEFDLRTIPGKECVPYDTKFINILTNETR